MPSTGQFVYILGLILMALCIADAALVRFAKFDLTGYAYTPIILGGIGIVLVNASRFLQRSPAAEEE
jgi:hypothetical protein